MSPSAVPSKHNAPGDTVAEQDRDPLQTAMGARVRRLRARRGITRKVLAQIANVSERHLGATILRPCPQRAPILA